jgi:acyl dehydratase
MPRPGESVAGLTATLGPYQIPTARMAVAHSLTWSTSEMHSVATAHEDDAAAGRQPIVAGPWIAAVLAGLYARSDAAARLRDSGVRLAAPTQMEIRYHHPVRGDDVIVARCTVQAVAAPHDGRAGTVVIADECSATDGRPLLSCTRTYEYPWPANA